MYEAETVTTLYAVWTTDEVPTPEEGYTVHFDKNGGEGDMGDQVIKVYSPTTLAVNNFHRDGYRFLGWSTNKDALVASIQDQMQVTHLAEKGETITLFAIWQSKSVDPIDPSPGPDATGYTIQYDANGGFGTMADQIVATDEDTKLATNIFTRDAYTFKGWSTNAESDAVSLTDEQVVNHLTDAGTTITLYAVWHDNSVPEPEPSQSYTVQFNANGGRGIMASQTIEVDAKMALAKNVFTKDNYRFIGWSQDPDATQRSLKDEQVVNHLTEAGETIVLYAVWQSTEIEPVDPSTAYVIHYEANGGTGTMSDQDVPVDTETALVKNTFKRNGYKFIGWSTVATAKAASLTDEQVVTNLAEARQEITLWAVWQDENVEPVDPSASYTVHFDANGGKGTMADQTIAVDEKTQLASNGFNKQGFTFLGWSTNKDAKATDRLYANTAEVINLAEAKGTITLYAIWKENKNIPVDPDSTAYTVHFDANEGDGEMDDQVILYDDPTPLNRNAFTRTGYTFIGWSKAEDAVDAVLTDEGIAYNLAAVGESATLYAVWKANDAPEPEPANTYTVRFEPNFEGAVPSMADQVIEVGVATKLNKNVFTRDGYRFLGWSIYADSTSASLTDEQEFDSGVKGATIVLYAVWQSTDVAPVDPTTAYTVHFDANGGVGTMSDQLIANGVRTKLAANMFTKEGCQFLGWGTSADATATGDEFWSDEQEVLDLAQSAETKTLYAIWVQVPVDPVDPGNPDEPDDPGNQKATAYTIRFHANDGSAEEQTVEQVVRVGVQTPLNRHTFTREGYTFVGWSKEDKDATSATYYDCEPVTDIAKPGTRVNLYAVWRSNETPAPDPATSFTIHFDANEGSGRMADLTVEVGGSVKLPENGFTRTGYRFASWNTAADGYGDSYNAGEEVALTAVAGETVKLYAQWANSTPSVVDPELVDIPYYVYDGKAKDLIKTPGSTTDGTFKYALSTVPEHRAGDKFGEDLPTAVNAGTYYVLYYVKGDETHDDTKIKVLGPITIGKAVESIPASVTGLEYNGSEQTGIQVTDDEGSIYTIEGNKATDAGEHTAIVTLKDPANYKWENKTEESGVMMTALEGDLEDESDATREIPWSIAKHNVDIEVLNANKMQNQADPEFSTVVSGTVNGEVLTQGVDYTVVRDEGENPGSYTITALAQDTKAMNNYDPTVKNGTLTIQAVQTENNKGQSSLASYLTSTGDVAIMSIYCVATILVVAACALVFTKRRKRKNGEK